MSSQSRQRGNNSADRTRSSGNGPDLRFTDWSTVGERTFTPDDLTEVVGSFVMDQDADTL